nr:ComEC/Rec2 family competence protein [Metamycoplasma canadense]
MLLKIKNPKLFNISNKILFELNLQEIKFLNKESTFKIFFSENKIIEEYINIIVLNKYEKNSLIYKKLVNLNIIHFFTISGFHFNLIYLTITKLIKKIKIKIPIDDFFAFSFLIIYLTILEFKISATRSLIFLLLIFLNKNIFNKKMNNINLLSITAVLLATLNPFAIYDYSFILSFLITLFIFITVYIFKNKNFYFKSIMVLIIAHLFSTLIIHTFNDKYNVFSFFNQVLLLPLISLNYIFTLIFFKWSIVSEKLILFFDTILNLLNEATYIVKFEISNFICIYFCSIFLILRKLKFYKSIKINQ